MTLVFLGLLALAWMAIFLPAILRARAEAPMWTTERFKRRMDALAPRSGRWIVMPAPHERLRAEAMRRRQSRLRRILGGLVVAIAVTFVAAVVAGGPAWELHLATLGITGIYVVWLREVKRRRSERIRKVRAIPTTAHDDAGEDGLLAERAVAQRG